MTSLGAISVGLFAEPVPGDPTTFVSGIIHSIGATLMFCSPGVTFLLVGWQLRNRPGWRGYGWYSFVTGLITYVLVGILFKTTVYGLVERLLLMAGFAWYVVIGGRFLAQSSCPSK